jgi:branched-chain amino acid transport system substrate-binding protein
MGHQCSGAAIPASRIYAAAGVLMMTPNPTNPVITEQVFANMFRFCGRDDLQGAMADTYLADRWAGKNIAIVHDGQAYGGVPRRAQRRRDPVAGAGATADRARASRCVA